MKRMESKYALVKALLGSGIFDIFGGLYFSLLIGNGRGINHPPTHPFYAVMIGMFLLCLGLLQLLWARNIMDFPSILGIIILSRVFYVILFFSYYLLDKDFPPTFLPTALADLLWVVLYFVLIVRNKKLTIREIFLPRSYDD